MRPLLKLAILLLCLACEKEPSMQPASAPFLKQIMVDDKVYMSFEYNEGLLAREARFAAECEESPLFEFSYVYENGKLSGIRHMTKMLYSNTNKICDPSSGLRFTTNFEYNTDGMISKVVGDSSYTEFFYNQEGLIEKYVVYDLKGQEYAGNYYEYDPRGNLIQVTYSDGNATHYEYDNKINPFYRMNQRPGWISPFNKSPNNVIKATGRENFERTFEYNEEGLPIRLLEDNGLTYSYYYQ